MPAHYAQLIAAAEAPVVTEAYRKGREALDAAVNRILVRAGVSLTPSLVVALVDGGAVKAISEGYDVREIARMLLDSAVALGWWLWHLPPIVAKNRRLALSYEQATRRSARAASLDFLMYRKHCAIAKEALIPSD